MTLTLGWPVTSTSWGEVIVYVKDLDRHRPSQEKVRAPIPRGHSQVTQGPCSTPPHSGPIQRGQGVHHRGQWLCCPSGGENRSKFSGCIKNKQHSIYSVSCTDDIWLENTVLLKIMELLNYIHVCTNHERIYSTNASIYCVHASFMASSFLALTFSGFYYFPWGHFKEFFIGVYDCYLRFCYPRVTSLYVHQAGKDTFCS